MLHHSRSRQILPLFLYALASYLAWPAMAQSRYILSVQSGADVNAIASRYQLSLQRRLCESGERYSVFSAAPLSDNAVALVRSETGVRGFEVDALIRSAETEPARRPGELDLLPDISTQTNSMDFFGDQVRAVFVNQRASEIIGLATAHQRYGAGSGVIAIIDTGVDTAHPALWRSLVAGYDFTRDRADTVSEWLDLDQSTVALLGASAAALLTEKTIPAALGQSTVVILDKLTLSLLDTSKLPATFGHGTMVAGLVHLVAPRARIMPLKAFRADGSASLSDIVRAIRYAADHGADVISMSFSMPAASPELRDALDYAYSKGSVLVAAAGNSGKEATVYPAAANYVIGVGSTNARDRRSPFSNYDGSARMSAPGEALLTTFPGNNYAAVWGTSFSAALAAGAVALFQQVRSHVDYQEAIGAFDQGVEISQDMGKARLDLPRSLAYLSRSH